MTIFILPLFDKYKVEQEVVNEAHHILFLFAPKPLNHKTWT
jgi:hypothetical protein